MNDLRFLDLTTELLENCDICQADKRSSGGLPVWESAGEPLSVGRRRPSSREVVGGSLSFGLGGCRDAATGRHDAQELMSAATGTTAAGRPGDGHLIAEIAAHSARVRKGNHRCSLSCCPHCGRAPEPTLFFRRHALRQRKFLVIQGRYIHAVEGLLARWRCPFCRRTFTEYPPFALPFKRI